MKDDFARIIREVFALDPKWVEWFMSNVFKEEELCMAVAEARPAAVLLNTPYQIEFQGLKLQCDYISCVATVPSQRGKGLMRGLMRDALAAAWEKETPLAAIIPASDPLYFIYDRIGFATVFYANEERYTSLHEFKMADYVAATPSYEVFRRLEDMRQGAVVHNEEQYNNTIADMKLGNGFVAAVSNGNDSHGMAFAQVDSVIKVLDVLATDDDAAEAALAEARRMGGEKPVIVSALPKDGDSSLRARGMIRIINAQAMLEALALANPSLKATIRLRDSFLPKNNGIYHIEGGFCKKKDKANQSFDIDTTIDVLAKILFSAKRVGELFGLRTDRPFISLMLD